MDQAVLKGYDEVKGKYSGKLEPSQSLAFKDNLIR
jgi:hypothetical protein